MGPGILKGKVSARNSSVSRDHATLLLPVSSSLLDAKVIEPGSVVTPSSRAGRYYGFDLVGLQMERHSFSCWIPLLRNFE